jgi:hypothetical protein
MRPRRRFSFAAFAILLVTASGCMPRAASPPRQPMPPPQPAPPPAPPAPSPPPTAAVAWEDAPLAAGDWSYSGSGGTVQATFGTPGLVLFALRCDAGRQIAMFRPGAAGPVAIATSFGERSLPASGVQEAGTAALPAADPLFDQIAFSRGRFLVRAAGGADLVLPTWPEPARLIEDCRG